MRDKCEVYLSGGVEYEQWVMECSNYVKYRFCLISRAAKYKSERKSGNMVYRCFVGIIPYYLRVPSGSGFLFILSGILWRKCAL